MTEKAARAWEGVYEELSGGHSGLLGAITGRAEAQTIRLALLYALLDGSDQIDMPHLEAGLSVWQYCESSAEYIFGDLVGDPLADDILRAIRNAGSTGVARSEFYGMFTNHKSAAAIGAVLNTLMTAGKARKEMRAPAGMGRPAEVWMAV